MYKLNKFDIAYQSKFIKAYAFTLNLENISENFSHVKENIINIKESPTLFFDRNLNFSYIFNHMSPNLGEAGGLVEAFIGNQFYIDEMKKSIYNIGDFLDVKYFIQKDFNELIEGFKNAINNYNQLKIEKNSNFININQISSINCDIKDKTKEKENNVKKEVIIPNKNNSLLNSEEINIINNNDNEIILSRNNTYILTAETFDELMEKVEELKSKKIIVKDDAIKCINEMCWY